MTFPIRLQNLVIHSIEEDGHLSQFLLGLLLVQNQLIYTLFLLNFQIQQHLKILFFKFLQVNLDIMVHIQRQVGDFHLKF